MLLLLAPGTGGTAQEKPAGGPGEGIKVHGHWTIEVHQPDGTLVSRREFENALAPDVLGSGGGSRLLTRVLARDLTVGRWSVGILTREDCGIGRVGRDPSTSSFACMVSELGPFQVGYGELTSVSVPTSGPDAGKLVLLGNVETGGDVTVFAVTTLPETCSPTVPGGCGPADFTRHEPGGTLASAAAGQIITVKVVISFS
jgi:hypothetical protein